MVREPQLLFRLCVKEEQRTGLEDFLDGKLVFTLFPAGSQSFIYWSWSPDWFKLAHDRR